MTAAAPPDPAPTLADFADALGEPFVLVSASGTATLTLAAATATQGHPAPMMRAQPFSLTFQSDSTDVLPQAIYPLRNATLGTVEIFIVPIERSANGVVYEAVFA